MWVLVGAVSAFLAVAAGAFGAHGLKQHLSADQLALWETAARYQMYHALALVALGVWVGPRPGGPGGRCRRAAGWCFTVGTLVFSGTVYALALGGARWLGAVTPIGGVLFLAGWGALAYGGWRSARRPREADPER